jgi:DNA-binding response OmpR family regulator
MGSQVKLAETEIQLTSRELDLLRIFVANKGKVVKRVDILHAISHAGTVYKERSINRIICRLRKKIEADPHHPKRLVSVRGLGYRLKD